MSRVQKITLPDIGDFKDVEVIEVLVSPGKHVGVEDPLITLETDKASIEIPSPQVGIVTKVLVGVGDRVSQGDAILELEVASIEQTQEQSQTDPGGVTDSSLSSSGPMAGSGSESLKAEVVVLGSGPGGYTAAFRAADLGKSVVLIEQSDTLGGVCLNVGCIPSKTLLHAAQVINEAAQFAKHGVEFSKPKIDLTKLRAWKDGVVQRLTGGLKHLAKQRKVHVLQGYGRFVSADCIQVETAQGQKRVSFEQAIVAAGSRPAKLPLFPWKDPRVMDSTAALEISTVPGRLLVAGGGVIGLELATVYHALGSRVTIAELTDGLIPGCDRDLVQPLLNVLRKRYENIFTGTKIIAVSAQDEGLNVTFQGNTDLESDIFDAILVATGRLPNGHEIGAQDAGLQVSEQGVIQVDSQLRTNVAHIFAIGDVTGPPMLAHKATHQGKIAAEVCAGKKSHFDARVIPSVAYTDPEVAWMGLTETEAKQQNIEYKTGVFPWAASGRSLSLGRTDGMTKLLFGDDMRLLGAGIVGPNAGELIAEAVVAIEMNADAQDIALSIHPHPTLSETINFAAEIAEGTITDLYIPNKT